MITLWAFGTTQGLEYISFNPKFTAPVDIDSTVLREVQFDSGIPTIFIQRIRIGSSDLTWVGLYKSVFEVGYQRLGGYYGAGAWLQDHTVDPLLLLEVLTEIQELIFSSAIQNGQFQCKLKEVVGSIGPSDDISIRLMKTLIPQRTGVGLSSQSARHAILPAGNFNKDAILWAFKETCAQNYRGICIIPSLKNIVLAANSRFKFFETFLELNYSLMAELAYENQRKSQEILKLKEGLNTNEEVISDWQQRCDSLKQENLNLNDLLSKYKKRDDDNHLLESQNLRSIDMPLKSGVNFSGTSVARDFSRESSYVLPNLSYYLDNQEVGRGYKSWRSGIFTISTSIMIGLFLNFLSSKSLLPDAVAFLTNNDLYFWLSIGFILPFILCAFVVLFGVITDNDVSAVLDKFSKSRLFLILVGFFIFSLTCYVSGGINLFGKPSIDVTSPPPTQSPLGYRDWNLNPYPRGLPKDPFNDLYDNSR